MERPCKKPGGTGDAGRGLPLPRPQHREVPRLDCPAPGRHGRAQGLLGYFFLPLFANFVRFISTTRAPIGFPSDRTGTETWRW